jgi:hypothetical protein
MAHFAQLDENNVVTAVVVVHNNELAAETEVVIEDGFIKEKLVLSEEKGIQFLQGLYGEDTRWAQTSYNGRFRGVYAGIGYTFVDGEFVSPEAPVVETPVVEAQAIESAQLETLTSTDISALTTSDISSLG